MSRILRVVVMAMALLAALTATASTAGAVTWHNSGDTAFTATGGAGTFSSTSVNLSCSGEDTTAVVTATPAAGASWTSMTFTTRKTGCLVSGNDWPWECKRTFTAITQSGNVTTGTLDTTCDIYLASVNICHVSGTVTATYTNPTQPSTFGRFQTSTGGTLRIFNGVSNCPLGNGDPLHMSPETITVQTATGGPTPHLGPIITRTA